MSTEAQTNSLVVFHKTRMCHFYQKGCCARGTQCVFAHCPSELRPPPDFARTRMCERLLETGSCDILECKYAHSRKELRTRRSTAAEIAVRDSPKGAISKKTQKNSNVKPQTHNDSDDDDVEVSCPYDDEVSRPTDLFSRQSTADLDKDFGPSNWCRNTSIGKDSSQDSTDFSWSSHGMDVTLRNSFLHFGPLAAMPLRRCSASVPPSHKAG